MKETSGRLLAGFREAMKASMRMVNVVAGHCLIIVICLTLLFCAAGVRNVVYADQVFHPGFALSDLVDKDMPESSLEYLKRYMDEDVMEGLDSSCTPHEYLCAYMEKDPTYIQRVIFCEACQQLTGEDMVVH